MVNLKARADINGLTDNFMKVNGWMGWSMDMECGKEPMKIHI